MEIGGWVQAPRPSRFNGGHRASGTSVFYLFPNATASALSEHWLPPGRLCPGGPLWPLTRKLILKFQKPRWRTWKTKTMFGMDKKRVFVGTWLQFFFSFLLTAATHKVSGGQGPKFGSLESEINLAWDSVIYFRYILDIFCHAVCSSIFICLSWKNPTFCFVFVNFAWFLLLKKQCSCSLQIFL